MLDQGQRGRESETVLELLTILVIEARCLEFVERIHLALYRQMLFYYATRPFVMYSLRSTFRFPAKFPLLAASIVLAVPGMLSGQDAKSKLKSPITDPTAAKASATPSASNGRARSTPDKTMLEAAQQALGDAANKVLNRIQTEENDVHTRLGYFEKDDRLDPSTFKSADEVAQWRTLLSELKQRSDSVADLYNNLGKYLDIALRNAKVNEQIAARFKEEVMSGFPWDTIHKKTALMSEYIVDHGKLLDFYEKNWGSWKTASGTVVFQDAHLAVTFQKLRDQIINTGKELDQQYKALSEE
ncbi:MAG TPA: hypothetical protein VE242_09760 [Chthoniobacterales bacterium]|nr:hypothetical protein [Chthoniobacterales bacterium]